MDKTLVIRHKYSSQMPTGEQATEFAIAYMNYLAAAHVIGTHSFVPGLHDSFEAKLAGIQMSEFRCTYASYFPRSRFLYDMGVVSCLVIDRVIDAAEAA